MHINGKAYRTIWFEDNIVKIIDQTKLPHQFIIKDLKTVKDAINAIKVMEVRGAPLIGGTAAYGIALAVQENNNPEFIKKSGEELIQSRPTAINLKWAVNRMMNKLSGINSDQILDIALTETRPRNQGANLTSYELNEEEIPNTIITDNTGGILMQRGDVDMCIVGTDRTLSNGDVCNKIGTYLKALAAYDNNIPFYVALPSSTIDWDIKDHKQIPIEERNPEELSHLEGFDELGDIKKIQIYPKKSKSLNLAFDVTPAKYVTKLITEKGICDASLEGLNNLFK